MVGGWDDVEVGYLLGRGSSGSVYRAKCKDQHVAVKVFFQLLSCTNLSCSCHITTPYGHTATISLSCYHHTAIIVPARHLPCHGSCTCTLKLNQCPYAQRVLFPLTPSVQQGKFCSSPQDMHDIHKVFIRPVFLREI